MTFQLVLETCTPHAQDLYFKVAILQLELVLHSFQLEPVLCIPDLYYRVAIFQLEPVAIYQLELETVTSRTRLVLQSRDFRAGAQNLYFAYYTCTSKVAIFQPELETCTSRIILALQSCDFPASAGNLHTSRTRLVLQSCDSPARAGTTQFPARACTLHTRLVLQSRSFPARARTLYFAY